MFYEFFIAKRYFHSLRRTDLISNINYFSIAGIMIGVTAVIIDLSVMNGYNNEIKSKVIGLDAHIRIRGLLLRPIELNEIDIDRIKNIEHIKAISPYIFKEAFLSSANYQEGILLKGIDQNSVNEVTSLQDYIIEGKLDLNNVVSENEKHYPGILVSKLIAEKLGVKLFDKVFAVSINTDQPTLGLSPDSFVKIFRISGIYESGLYDYDNVIAFISLDSAQKLFKMDSDFHGFEIKTDSIDRTKEVKREIIKQVGSYYVVQTWYERNKNIFVWIQLQKLVGFILLTLIIIVATFNMISPLLLIVQAKKTDVGILKSLGATNRSIRKIFIYQGIFSAIIGIIMGLGLGFLLCWLQLKYNLISISADVYMLASLPVQMKVPDFVLVSVIVLVLCLTAILIPANKAAKVIPVEAIKDY